MALSFCSFSTSWGLSSIRTLSVSSNSSSSAGNPHSPMTRSMRDTKSARPELVGGDVDGDAQRRKAFLPPPPALPAHLPQDELADIVDQARLFRQRDELVRRHQAEGGALPARQRLHAGELPVMALNWGW